MANLKIASFRTPKNSRILLENWMLMSDEKITMLPESLTHWDPSTSVSLQRKITIDAIGIFQDCALSEQDKLQLSIVWHCPLTSLRGCLARHAILCEKNWTRTVECTLPSNLLADRIHIDTQITLASIPSSKSNYLGPKLPGSILWTDRCTLVLEGKGARFPVEAISFAERTWLAPEAAWHLEWDGGQDLEKPLLSGLRLFLNVDHPAIHDAIVKPQSTESKLIFSAIHFDVGRTLIMGSLKNEEFVQEVRKFEEGTIGLATQRLIRMLFPEISLTALKDHETGFLDCHLQQRLKLFRIGP